MRSAPLASRPPLRYRLNPWAVNAAGEGLLEDAAGEWMQFRDFETERAENVELRARIRILSASLKAADALVSKVKRKAPEVLEWEAEARKQSALGLQAPKKPVLYWDSEAEAYLKSRDAVGELS